VLKGRSKTDATDRLRRHRTSNKNPRLARESILENVEGSLLRLVLLLVHVFGEDPERRSWIEEHDAAGRSLPGVLVGLRFYFRRLPTDTARDPNFLLPALTIAKIYKSRWLVEIFFRFIKQHLRIKSFYGTSENAVKTQIWIAVSVYVLVAIVRKRLRLQASFYQILQILSLTLFEKMPILRALEAADSEYDLPDNANQLILFDF